MHRLFAEIVVDPVDSVFFEYPAQQFAEPARRFEVGAERLFDNDPSPSFFRCGDVQPGFFQSGRDRFVQYRRRGQVIDDPVGRAERFQQFADAVFQVAVSGVFGRFETDVMNHPEKFVDLSVVVRRAFGAPADAFALLLPERVVGIFAARGAQDREPFRQQPPHVEFEQRRHQLAPGQVARCPENNK